jgi:hypothetical protein
MTARATATTRTARRRASALAERGNFGPRVLVLSLRSMPAHRTSSAALMLALMLGAPAARADVYASEQDGVLHITSEKPRNTKVLFHLRDEGGRGVGPGSGPRAASASPRRSGATPKGDLPTREDLAPVVQKAAQYYNLPEALVWAVMKIESGFQPDVPSAPRRAGPHAAHAGHGRRHGRHRRLRSGAEHLRRRPLPAHPRQSSSTATSSRRSPATTRRRRGQP